MVTYYTKETIMYYKKNMPSIQHMKFNSLYLCETNIHPLQYIYVMWNGKCSLLILFSYQGIKK